MDEGSAGKVDAMPIKETFSGMIGNLTMIGRHYKPSIVCSDTCQCAFMKVLPTHKLTVSQSTDMHISVLTFLQIAPSLLFPLDRLK